MPVLTREQHRAARRVRATWPVIREHRESFPPHRLFLYVDDGVSQGGIDGITHEVSIRPDGLVLGEPDAEEWS